MSVPLDCPGSECWEAFLAATLPPDHRERCERHLESCTACQERLDRAGQCADELLQLAREVGDPTVAPADPTLSEVLERLHDVKVASGPAPGEPADLYFLRPADRPELLGALGDYEVQELIGEGGMGVVLKAYEPALHRHVAIKVMAPALAGSATARRRFTREAQAAAAVCHENIVAVHGVHEAAGLPYLVMQYVPGESLQARLDCTGPLEVVEVVRIGLQTAAGLAAAHAQGLIHRDIKPANLLLENGLARVKITDFGLARMADDVRLTQNGVLAGTPEYMAPEQARGEPVDHRADLFSLGSVLYAMCTGRAPFRGATAVAVLRQVSDQAPPPVRSLNPEVPAWLEALIARLLAKERGERLQSAAEVAGLLEGYLAHLRQPASVPAPDLPPSPAEEGSWVWESGWWAGVVEWLGRPAVWAAAVLLAVLGPALAQWFAGGAGGTDAKPAGPREFHQDFRAFEPNSQILRPVGQGGQPDDKGVRIILPAGQGILPAAGFAPGFSVRGDFEVTASFEVLRADRPDTGYGVGVSIYAAIDPNANDAVSLARRVLPDGKAVFMSDRLKPVDGKENHQLQTVPSASATGRLRFRRVGSVLRYFVADGPGAEFVPMGEVEFGTAEVRYVQVGGNAGQSQAGLDVRLLDFSVRADELPGLPAVEPAGPAKVRSKGWLAAGGIVGLGIALSFVAVCLYVRQSRRAGKAPAGQQSQPEAAAPLLSFACPGCGKKLRAKAGLTGKKVKCPHCRTPLRVTEDRPGEAGRASAKPWLLGAAALALLVLVAGTMAWLHRPKEGPSFLGTTLGSEPVADVQESGFSWPENFGGEPFRWTDGNGRLVIPVQKRQPPRGLLVRLKAFRGAGVHQASVRLVVNDHELFNDKIPIGTQWEQTFDLAGIDLGEQVVLDILSDTFNPLGGLDGDHISGDPRTLGVQVWGVKLLAAVERANDQAVAADAVVEQAAAAGNLIDRPLSIWYGHHPAGLSCGAVTPDGKTLVSGSRDGTVILWDVAASRERKTLPGLAPNLQAVAVSPDGKTFATAANDRVVRVWDAVTGDRRANLHGHTGEITSLAYSPEGKTLASAAGDRQRPGELKLWDWAAGKERVPIEPFPFRLWKVVYAPDGKSVAVAGGDKTAQVVDASNGRVLARFEQPAYVRSVAYSADGRFLAASYGDAGEVRINGLDDRKEWSAFRTPVGQLVLGLEFARNGKRLLAPCADGSTLVWDVSQPQARVVAVLSPWSMPALPPGMPARLALRRGEGTTLFATFLPNGRTVVTGGDDRTIRLWDVRNPE
jgi:WD40 repeat protein